MAVSSSPSHSSDGTTRRTRPPFWPVVLVALAACSPLPFSSPKGGQAGDVVTPPAEPQWVTYTGGGTPVAIPDANPTGVLADLYIPHSTEVIYDAEVSVTLTHTYFLDLDVDLETPQDLILNLLISQSYSGTWKLTWDFGAFVEGSTVGGLWQLTVKDLVAVDTGSLLSWEIRLLQGPPSEALSMPDNSGSDSPGPSAGSMPPPHDGQPVTLWEAPDQHGQDAGDDHESDGSPHRIGRPHAERGLTGTDDLVLPLMGTAHGAGQPAPGVTLHMGAFDLDVAQSMALPSGEALHTGTWKSMFPADRVGLGALRTDATGAPVSARQWTLGRSDERLELVMEDPFGATVWSRSASNSRSGSLVSGLYLLEPEGEQLWVATATVSGVDGFRLVPTGSTEWVLCLWRTSEGGHIDKHLLERPTGDGSWDWVRVPGYSVPLAGIHSALPVK